MFAHIWSSYSSRARTGVAPVRLPPSRWPDEANHSTRGGRLHMETTYERLQKATQPERDRFMSIPLVAMLLAEAPANAGPVSAADAAEITRIYTRFLVDSYYHV